MKQLSEVSQTDLITLRSRVGEELYQHLLDALCMEFLDEFPDGLIVSLGCGFDTRFWRLGGENLNYLELEIRIATRPSGLLCWTMSGCRP